jgi:hypothetical protein
MMNYEEYKCRRDILVAFYDISSKKRSTIDFCKHWKYYRLIILDAFSHTEALFHIHSFARLNAKRYLHCNQLDDPVNVYLNYRTDYLLWRLNWNRTKGTFHIFSGFFKTKIIISFSI